jgi:MFS family permease
MTQATEQAASRARWAITVVFAANGLLISSMAVRNPSLKLDLGLADSELGLSSAIFAIAAVVAMQTTGRLAARVGSAVIVRVAAPASTIALVVSAFAPDLATLALAFVLFGAVYGMLDVAMNAHAVAVETTLGRYIMNGCHAAWSIGAVGGSALGAGAAGLGLTRWQHYGILGIVLVATLLVTGRALLPAAVDRGARRPGASWRTGWTWRIVAIGLVGAIVLTCEGAVISWSGVFLHDERSASLGVAGLGFVAFTACQTAGRLIGDRVQARVSIGTLMRFGILLGAGGLLLAVVSPHPVPAIAGFGILGLGLSTTLPMLFGVVGRLGTQGSGDAAGAATGVARFATMTYAGVLLAPPAIGAIADQVGLGATLLGLVPLLVGVALAATAVTRESRRPAPTTTG